MDIQGRQMDSSELHIYVYFIDFAPINVLPQGRGGKQPQGNLAFLGMKMSNFPPLGVHLRSNSPEIAHKPP